MTILTYFLSFFIIIIFWTKTTKISLTFLEHKSIDPEPINQSK